MARILRNEVYKGYLLTNKVYKPSYLSKQRINRGEYPQYYIEDHHEPIVSKELFDRVHEIQKAGLLGTARDENRASYFRQRAKDEELRRIRHGEELATEKRKEQSQ